MYLSIYLPDIMISNTGYHCCCPVMTLSLSFSLSPTLTLPVPIPLSLLRCSLSIYSQMPTGYWMVVVPPDLHKIINGLYPKEWHTRRTITFHYYYYYPHPSLYTHTSSNRHEPSERSDYSLSPPCDDDAEDWESDSDGFLSLCCPSELTHCLPASVGPAKWQE